jgi:hypothetical protein
MKDVNVPLLYVKSFRSTSRVAFSPARGSRLTVQAGRVTSRGSAISSSVRVWKRPVSSFSRTSTRSSQTRTARSS